MVFLLKSCIKGYSSHGCVIILMPEHEHPHATCIRSFKNTTIINYFQFQAVDYFIGYLNTNIQTLHSQLMPDIYPHMIEEIWNVILKSFHKQLEIGVGTV